MTCSARMLLSSQAWALPSGGEDGEPLCHFPQGHCQVSSTPLVHMDSHSKPWAWFLNHPLQVNVCG